MRSWLVRQLRKRKRVYIRPTKMGGYLIGLIFLMFLMSVGYNNNLLLIFTLVLFTLNLIWVLQTHFHLSRLKLKTFHIENGYAQTRTSFRVGWQKEFSDDELQCVLQTEKENFPVRTMKQNEDILSGEVVLPSRGLFQWRYFKVSTERPFGLYKVWIYFSLNEQSLAYPPLLKNLPFPETNDLTHEGENPSSEKGPHGVEDFNRYDQDESRRISWKHYARSGELLVKEGAMLKQEILKLTMDLPRDKSSKEKRLSELTTLLTMAHERQIPFHFTARRIYGPGFHQDLLRECLKELALC
jgi:uncharacterized protein (DUF58 family)